MNEIGKYRILSQIGSSAAGATYRVRSPGDPRDLTVKVLRSNPAISADARNAFLKKLAACAQLSHRRIAAVHDLGEADGSIYITTTYAKGPNLATWDTSEMSLERKLRFVAQISEGLAFAHAKGIAHGNLKPSNILAAGGKEALLLDFGTGDWQALLMACDERLPELRPNYLAPEQVLGKPFDNRSDLFSLAAILYLFVSGRHPFPVPDSVVLREIVHGEPEPLQKLVPDTPDLLEQLLRKAMKKDPAERLRTVDEFAAGLYAVARHLSPRPPARAAEPEPVAEPVAEASAAEPEAQLQEQPVQPQEPQVQHAEPQIQSLEVQSHEVQSEVAAPQPEEVQAEAPEAPPAAQWPKNAFAPFVDTPPVQDRQAHAPVEPAPQTPVAAKPEPAPVQAQVPPPRVEPQPQSVYTRTAPPQFDPAQSAALRELQAAVEQANQNRRRDRVIAITAAAVLALAIAGVIFSRPNLRASQSKTRVPAPASQVVQPKPAPEPEAAPAVNPAPAAQTPAETPKPPAPSASTAILRGQVRILWEAGNYARAMQVVDEVLAKEPDNAEARFWKKRIRSAQQAEAEMK